MNVAERHGDIGGGPEPPGSVIGGPDLSHRVGTLDRRAGDVRI